MKLFHAVLILTVCVFSANAVFADGGTRSASGSGAETVYQGNVKGGSKDTGNPCAGKADATPCQRNGSKGAKCYKQKCEVKDCQDGFYLVLSADGTKSDGYCTHGVASCSGIKECKDGGCKLRTTDFNGVKATVKKSVNGKRLFECIVFNDICTEEVKKELHAETGNPFVGASSDQDRCLPTKCVSGYILENAGTDDARCVACPECAPVNANCEKAGSDGISQCNYKTSCLDNFINEQNAGKYNPSCSSVACEPCKATNATCEVSVENNVCKYKTKCEEGFVDIQNDGKPDASCSPKAPDEFNVMYELDGGTGCDNSLRKYKSGTETNINCVPTKDGFEIDGWTLDGASITMPYIIPATITGDKKFVVGWKAITKERTECTDDEKAKFPHADAFLFVNGVCSPTHCERGYKLKDNECVDNGIKDAEDKYKNAKENETSFKNRMLGGLTMAATGIGGMELAQGLAEKKADEAAAADMQAYLATFQCRIGEKGGKSYPGGTKNIETPGANQLVDLYSQYVSLASDLKERKNALSMRPGIESEVIIDKSTTGLYDDVGNGVQNGTYASLYRASKGNEIDQAKLDDQKATSAKRVKGGAIAAGGGAIAGIGGNIAANYVDWGGGDDAKEKVTEADCKKVKGTYKDGKCTCPGKDKVYKDGKCVDKNESGKDLLKKGASMAQQFMKK